MCNVTKKRFPSIHNYRWYYEQRCLRRDFIARPLRRKPALSIDHSESSKEWLARSEKPRPWGGPFALQFSVTAS